MLESVLLDHCSKPLIYTCRQYTTLKFHHANEGHVHIFYSHIKTRCNLYKVTPRKAKDLATKQLSHAAIKTKIG